MFCRYCGKEVSENAYACTNCGVPPKDGDRYCNNCGVDTKPNAMICDSCGESFGTVAYKSDDKTEKKKGINISTTQGTLIIIVFVFAFGTVMRLFVDLDSSYENSPSASPSPEQESKSRKEIIDDQFCPWTGKHLRVVSYVRMNMNDPSSFDHVETRYLDKGDHLIVYMKFRGKNAFGGIVANEVTAKVDLNGNILELK